MISETKFRVETPYGVNFFQNFHFQKHVPIILKKLAKKNFKNLIMVNNPNNNNNNNNRRTDDANVKVFRGTSFMGRLGQYSRSVVRLCVLLLPSYICSGVFGAGVWFVCEMVLNRNYDAGHTTLVQDEGWREKWRKGYMPHVHG